MQYSAPRGQKSQSWVPGILFAQFKLPWALVAVERKAKGAEPGYMRNEAHSINRNLHKSCLKILATMTKQPCE